MSKLATNIVLLITIGVLAFSINARADEWNQKTVFTFSGPVEIPGQILPAGTYVFKLADSTATRQIVQVFNKEENRIFGTFLTIPDYHLRPSEKPLIKFHERPAGQPDAIKAWFYPGRNYGHEFVYPKKEAVALAQVNHTPVPAMPAELEPVTTQPNVAFRGPEITALVIAPLLAEEPDGREVNLDEAFAITEAAAPVSDDAAEKLPETASLLPAIGLAGAIALFAALGLRLR